MNNEVTSKENKLLDALLKTLDVKYTYIDKGENENLYFFIVPSLKETWNEVTNENSNYVVFKTDNDKWIYSTVVCTYQGDYENPPEYEAEDSIEYITRDRAILAMVRYIEDVRLDNIFNNIEENVFYDNLEEEDIFLRDFE